MGFCSTVHPPFVKNIPSFTHLSSLFTCSAPFLSLKRCASGSWCTLGVTISFNSCWTGSTFRKSRSRIRSNSSQARDRDVRWCTQRAHGGWSELRAPRLIVVFDQTEDVLQVFVPPEFDVWLIYIRFIWLNCQTFEENNRMILKRIQNQLLLLFTSIYFLIKISFLSSPEWF